MKLKLFTKVLCFNLIMACSGQMAQAAGQPLASQNITVASNGSKQAISCTKNDYETASKCLYVKVNCPEGNLACNNVDLTITNKADGKSQKLKGKICYNKVNMNFNGYVFNSPKGIY